MEKSVSFSEEFILDMCCLTECSVTLNSFASSCLLMWGLRMISSTMRALTGPMRTPSRNRLSLACLVNLLLIGAPELPRDGR